MFVGLVCNVIGMNQWHFKVAIHGVTKNACLFDKIYIAIKILHKKARTKAPHVQAFNRLGFLLNTHPVGSPDQHPGAGVRLVNSKMLLA